MKEHKPAMLFNFYNGTGFVSPSNDVIPIEEVLEILNHYFVLLDDNKELMAALKKMMSSANHDQDIDAWEAAEKVTKRLEREKYVSSLPQVPRTVIE